MKSQRMYRIVEGEALILDPETGHYYSVNPVGTTILKGVLERQSVEAIAEKVTRSHPGSPETVLSDVQAFSKILAEEELDQLDPDSDSGDSLEPFDYQAPALNKYDQLRLVAAYSPDEL